ncbi:hypothetical protein CU669_18515 [Paramagnetospirillum kuznetsovii]|uniref:Methyltransferase type 12 domain-containing protein n=1 Tax=Paramagnetospirillum kuznetsovii TaxID=2053833 RepID=A0A364NU59_9PROT|nr:class I SAM-dependent methyltransferase [Paramagnetospirillum kuznetsovii]RAU20445.1 hypothetical protein CU669_18515 [Paramagnetospirillum kuznetsovii]
MTQQRNLLVEAQAALQAGNAGEAQRLCRAAIAADGDSGDARAILGASALLARDAVSAEAEFRAELRLRPHAAQGYLNLGRALGALSRTGEAADSFLRATQLSPNHPEAHFFLGVAQRKQGRTDGAAISFDRVIALVPHAVPAHQNLIEVMREAGRPADALACARRAIQLCPAEPEFLRVFSELAADFQFSQADDDLRGILARALGHPSVQPVVVGAAALSAVAADPSVAALLAKAGTVETWPADAVEDAMERLGGNGLLLRLLGMIPLCDPAFERLLTGLRRRILMGDVGRDTPSGLTFAAALAAQCFINEYVFAETEDENGRIEALIADHRPKDPWTLVIVAAYRPLHRLDLDWPLSAAASSLGDLIRLQVDEPAQELNLRDSIPALTGVHDTVSVAVRSQYETNPYPRWVRPSVAPSRGSVDAAVKAMSGGVHSGQATTNGRTEVLVAGCGTGQQSIWAATSYDGAAVLAIDLSLSSLAYALRQTRAHGIENIEYAQADILNLGDLARRFDVIECGGVLHHLGDPLAGWRALVPLLKPGGLMKIALYSEAARAGEVAAQALIKQRGYSSSAQDIRRFRQDILSLPTDHPAASIANATDFYSTSACRDQVFHVQEHRFSIPRIQAALKELGLTFCGFYFLEAGVMAEFGRRFPNDPGMLSLENWRQLEAEHPSAFRQMYQFGVLKPL